MNALRLTVDSSEPLEDAIRVLGALYGVTLVVSNEGPGAPTSTQQLKPRAKRVATKPQTRAGVAGTEAKRSRRGASARSAGTASNAEVRSWARHAGLAVSDRGRLPASVMTAYRSAHD